MNKRIGFKIVRLTVITSLLVPSTAASAQSSRFTGLTLEAATGYQEMTTKTHNVKINNSQVNLANRDLLFTGVPFALNIGYSVVINETIGLGARFEYNPQTARIALSTMPSLALTQNLQAYGKLGWAYMASTVNPTIPSVIIGDQTAYFNGPLVGIGAKFILTDNVYVFAELTYYKYTDLRFAAQKGSINLSATVSSSAHNALIGLGYKF